MGYLIFAVVMAAILITVLTLKDRLSRSPGRSVDAFRKAITALTPEDEAEEGGGTPGTEGQGDTDRGLRKRRL
jgi:hypothetical protein